MLNVHLVAHIWHNNIFCLAYLNTLAAFDENVPKDTLINGEPAKVYEHLIKWLGEIIKNRKRSAAYATSLETLS